MRRLSLPMLLAVALLAGVSGSARAASPFAAISTSTAAASARTGAELKAAQGSVDAALKLRKQRLDIWQRAQKARDVAAADVTKKKKSGLTGSALEDALKSALALDEDAAQARSQLLAAESTVAQKGAQLLQLYDAMLVDRRGAVEALPPSSTSRAQAVSAFRDLAAQRDAVRAALLPVLAPSVDLSSGASLDFAKGVDLDGRPDDDVESLLEKADLARDLEDRFLRQAQAVRKRIQELEDERAVARGVSGMVGRSQLFDEEDRRVVVARPESSSTQQLSSQSPQAPGTSSTPRTQSPAAPSPGAPGGGTGGIGALDGAHTPQDFSPSTGVGGSESPPSSAFALTQAPSVVHTEQGFAAPQTDSGIAGLLSSQHVSVESLKALEQKLKAKAAELSAKEKKLKAQANQSR